MDRIYIVQLFKKTNLIRFVIIPTALLLIYLFGYIISHKVLISTPLFDSRVLHPANTPLHLFSGFHGNQTQRTQPEQGDKHPQNGGAVEFNPNSQWIYHMNYKTLLHSPRPTFLPHYRSPCLETGSSVLCLPSVYLAGMPKCGTSELYSKLVQHPDVQVTRKEPHWWTRLRFRSDIASVGDYMERYYTAASKRISEKCYHEGNMCYHPDLIVDSSASTFWDNFKWHLFPGNENKKEPVILTAHHIKHLTPDIKVIVIFRNPIDRLYSDYLYFKTSLTSANDFHKKVTKSIQSFSSCLKSYSARQCAYNVTVKNTLPVRLAIGLYSIYVNDWLNILPRDQFYFVKLEEYSKDKNTIMKDIFKFLLLGPPPRSYFDIIQELPKKKKVPTATLR